MYLRYLLNLIRVDTVGWFEPFFYVELLNVSVWVLQFPSPHSHRNHELEERKIVCNV